MGSRSRSPSEEVMELSLSADISTLPSLEGKVLPLSLFHGRVSGKCSILEPKIITTLSLQNCRYFTTCICTRPIMMRATVA